MSGERFEGKIVSGVMVVAAHPDGRLLFVAQQKGPFGGHWLLPGGGIEYGESAVEAAVREFREETGLELEAPRFVGVYEMRGRWQHGSYHLIMLCFAGTAQGEIPPGFEGDGVGGVRWARLGEIPLHATDLRILTDAGLAAFDEAEIAAALEQAGIQLKVYQ
ncbi:MAG: NUDIX hydrolase [Bacillota bacterium]